MRYYTVGLCHRRCFVFGHVHVDPIQ